MGQLPNPAREETDPADRLRAGASNFPGALIDNVLLRKAFSWGRTRF